MGTDTVTVARDDVRAARERLDGLVRRTPVVRVGADELGGTHGPFWLKLESLQSTGSFKARGALNNMLAGDLPEAGVCAASGGNHGQAVARAARRLGVPASIFVPVTCPGVKLRRMEGYGAAVTVVGDVYEDSLVHAELHARRTGAC